MEINDFKIKTFEISDLPEIMEIERNSFPNKISFPKDYFLRLYFDFPEGFLVAKLKKEILGYGIGTIKEGEGKIISLAVKKNWQRKGIGKKLVEILIEKFKKKKIKSVSLHLREENKVALSFYQKLGFKIFKKIKNYYSNGDNAYLMERKI